MRTPTEFELQHLGTRYDPVKAHEYYEKHKHLIGRHRGATQKQVGLTRSRRISSAKTKQRQELQDRIRSLSSKLAQLEDLIRKKQHQEASSNRKSTAKQERAAKEKDKPKTAAEKAKANRESKKYRDKHRQTLKSKSGGGSSSKKTNSKTVSSSDLKALATRVRGQIAIAKQKLAAL